MTFDFQFSVRLGSYKSRNSEKWISISEFASRVDMSKVVSLSLSFSSLTLNRRGDGGTGALPVAGGGVNMCFEAVLLRPCEAANPAGLLGGRI